MSIAKSKKRKKKKPYGNPCRSCKGLFGHHYWFCLKPMERTSAEKV